MLLRQTHILLLHDYEYKNIKIGKLVWETQLNLLKPSGNFTYHWV
jgi:hypothetical protein